VGLVAGRERFPDGDALRRMGPQVNGVVVPAVPARAHPIPLAAPRRAPSTRTRSSYPVPADRRSRATRVCHREPLCPEGKDETHPSILFPLPNPASRPARIGPPGIGGENWFRVAQQASLPNHPRRVAVPLPAPGTTQRAGHRRRTHPRQFSSLGAGPPVANRRRVYEHGGPRPARSEHPQTPILPLRSRTTSGGRRNATPSRPWNGFRM